jgi:Ca2+/Na+ antiporter
MFVFGLLTTILPVVIVIFTIAYIAKNKNKEDEESMIRHLYTYLVLFATLMMVIGGGISIFMATADLVSPAGYYQSFSDYERENKQVGENTQITEEELRADYEQIVDDEKARIRENAKNQIIKSLGFIIIPLPIFLYFNRMRKKQTE